MQIINVTTILILEHKGELKLAKSQVSCYNNRKLFTCTLFGADEKCANAGANHSKRSAWENSPSEEISWPVKNKLKTLSHLSRQKKGIAGGHKADRSLFRRILVMAQGRNLQMEEILSHALGPLPWALSTPDGFLRKTNKAALETCFKTMCRWLKKFQVTKLQLLTEWV